MIKKIEKVSTVKNRVRKLRDIIVRLRDSGVCQFGKRSCCTRKKYSRKKPIVHVSHIRPVGMFPWMEFDVENCKLLCYFCHFRWWHTDPLGASFWVASYLEEGRLLQIMESSDNPFKVTLDFLYEKEVEHMMTIKLLQLAGILKGRVQW